MPWPTDEPVGVGRFDGLSNIIDIVIAIIMILDIIIASL